MIRKRELCKGEAMCPESIVTARGSDGLATQVDRCHECPLFRLESEMESPAGGLIGRAQLIGYALEKGFQITLSDVRCDEFNALRILDEERDRYAEDMRSKAE